METGESREPESCPDTISYEQTASHSDTVSPPIELTPNSTIEQVDIKTEPPDLMDTFEASADNENREVPEKDSTVVSLRIEAIESKVNYESENLKDLNLLDAEENNSSKDPADLTGQSEESLMLIKQEIDAPDLFAPEVSICYDSPTLEESKEGDDLRKSLQEEILLKVEVEDHNYEGEGSKAVNCEDVQIKSELPTSHSIASDNQVTSHPMSIAIHASLPTETESAFAASNECIGTSDLKKIRLSSQSAPDQMTQLHVYNSNFQLNSITGDMLSLEQEAYGLLEAKNETKVKVVGHPFVCNKCPKACRDRPALSRHMKVHTTIERRAEGVARGKRTRELNNKKKQDLASRGFKQDKKRKDLPPGEHKRGRKKKDLASGKLSQDVSTIPYLAPGKLSQDGSVIPYHYKRPPKGESSKGQFKCIQCGKQYRLLPCLRRHQIECQDIVEPEPPIKKVKGALQKEARLLRNAKMVKSETKRENGDYKCECGNTFSRRSRLETCLRSHHPEIESRRYSCPVCTKPFKDKSELVLHRKRQHVKKKFLCKFCPMDYHTQKELFDHLRVHKKVQMMEYKVITEVVEGKQVLRCFICNKTFAELSELKAHVLVDHKEPYTCPLCKQNFPTIVDFATHTKSAHSEVEGQSVLDVLEAFSILAEAWKCEECHVQFEDPDDLVKHQKEQHGPVSKKQSESSDESSKFQFRCEDCRRTFSTLKQLTTHRYVHHTIKEPNLKDNDEESIPERIPTPPPPRPMCVHCRKICIDEATLTSHLRLHSIERKYPCKFCDFRFATLEKRKSHSAIHTGDMKFVCFICEYRCTSENRLNYHKQTPKHLDLKQALLNGPPLEPQAPIVTPEVKKKRFSSERKKSKSAEAPSTCDVCGEEFPSEEAMATHKDTHPFIVFPNEEQPTRIFFK